MWSNIRQSDSTWTQENSLLKKMVLMDFGERRDMKLAVSDIIGVTIH